MVIGNGLLASAFNPSFSENDDVIVFASGVSNSKETRKKEFLREKIKLIESLNLNKYILYFGTCSLYDSTLSKTPYILHKHEMEALVRSAKNYTIIRLPQLVGKTSNPNTLTNYLYKQISSENHFQVWQHAKRNLIDIDDIAIITQYLHQNHTINNSIINIACPFSISVVDLVKVFESVLEKKAYFTMVTLGNSYIIDTTLSDQAAKQLDLKFNALYVKNLIRKYYGSR